MTAEAAASCDPDYGWINGPEGSNKCYMVLKVGRYFSDVTLVSLDIVWPGGSNKSWSSRWVDTYLRKVIESKGACDCDSAVGEQNKWSIVE